MTAQRPGGRSARVRAAVHQAVVDLLGEKDWTALSIPLVATRSGVHQATVYRRWGSLANLINDVVTEQLSAQSPLPDTGSLRGDLEGWAVQLAEDVASPSGLVYLRAAVLALGTDQDPAEGYLAERGAQIQAMLERARDRGERPPEIRDILELLIAPTYWYGLFTGYRVTREHALDLADRLLKLAAN